MMELPSTELINDKRIARFKQRITDALASDKSALFYQLVEQYQQEHDVTTLEVAGALAQMLQGDTPFLLQNKPMRKAASDWKKDLGSAEGKPTRRARDSRADDKPPRRERERSNRRDSSREQGMQGYRIEVGRNHGVMPSNIVGAIANETGMDSKHIGRIKIFDDYSLVDLPEGMPKQMFNTLKKVRASGQPLSISKIEREGKSDNRDTYSEPGKPKGRTKIKTKKRHKFSKDKGKPKRLKVKESAAS